MKTIDNMTVPQVKIITMTEDELTAKMDAFRRQVLSEIKSLLTEQQAQTQTQPPSPAEPSRSGEYWVSAKELSKKYGVCVGTIWEWCKSGKIPQPTKMSEKGCTRWNLTEVEQKLNPKCA